MRPRVMPSRVADVVTESILPRLSTRAACDQKRGHAQDADPEPEGRDHWLPGDEPLQVGAGQGPQPATTVAIRRVFVMSASGSRMP